MHAERVLGLRLPVNHKRVERLMRAAGLQGLHKRRTRRGGGCAATEDDLIHRQFHVDVPDRLWLTDITEHPTGEWKVYCGAVMNGFSRRIVGWSISDRIKTELVIDALGMAILRRPREERGRRQDDPTFGPRDAIHILGLREATTRRRPARLDGHRRRLLRQQHDGIVLEQHAA